MLSYNLPKKSEHMLMSPFYRCRNEDWGPQSWEAKEPGFQTAPWLRSHLAVVYSPENSRAEGTGTTACQLLGSQRQAPTPRTHSSLSRSKLTVRPRNSAPSSPSVSNHLP